MHAKSDGFSAYEVNWKLWALWLGLFFVVSAAFPRDAHFDIAHYHLHNGWSILEGRINRDMAPAELHSFLNPLHSAFIWLLVDHLPGPLVNGLLGLIQGLLFPGSLCLHGALGLSVWGSNIKAVDCARRADRLFMPAQLDDVSDPAQRSLGGFGVHSGDDAIDRQRSSWIIHADNRGLRVTAWFDVRIEDHQLSLRGWVCGNGYGGNQGRS